ncbi:hypothetical protein DFJ74DRAFT_679383 [Hyaloraphidium curvatum]|nr:hypothetical protein DFJ74DRAFT_679383 [Hyaloraphidium curvatum]
MNAAGAALRASFDRSRPADVLLADATTAMNLYTAASNELALSLSAADPSDPSLHPRLRDARIRALAHTGESSARRALLLASADLFRDAREAFDAALACVSEAQYYADERFAEMLARGEPGDGTGGGGSELGVAIGMLLSEAQQLRGVLAQKHARLTAQLAPMIAARDAARANMGEERWGRREPGKGPSRWAIERREVQAKIRDIEAREIHPRMEPHTVTKYPLRSRTRPSGPRRK